MNPVQADSVGLAIPAILSAHVELRSSENIGCDRAGQLITMTDPPNGTAPARTTTLDRNPDGTVMDRTLHSGGAGTSVIDQWTYTYDATGRVASRARSGAGSVSEVFGYDEAGRLATINTGQVNYDPNGNRLSGPGDIPTLSFRADNSIATGPGPNGSGTEAYLYAPWGGLTRDACRSYTYDGFDRSRTTNIRLTLDLVPRCNLVEALLEANDHKRYDPLGRNIWARHDRLNLAGNPVSTQYLHLHHVGLDQELLYEQVVGAANRSGRYVNTPGGTPLAVIDNNNNREFLHRHGQGDTVLAINDAGVSQCAPAMDPWGESDTDCDNPVTPASPNRKWYNSSRLDTATDTYQWGARTYNPSTATWQQPDTPALSGAPSQVSIGSDPLAANRYSYVNGDPINYADPTGHILEECYTGEYVCESRSDGPPRPVERRVECSACEIFDSILNPGNSESSDASVDAGPLSVVAAGLPGFDFLNQIMNPMHDAVVAVVAEENGLMMEWGCAIPGGSKSNSGSDGRADLCQGESIWEVKFNGPNSGLQAALADVEHYLAACAAAGDQCQFKRAGDRLPSGRIRGPIGQIVYWSPAPGVVLYYPELWIPGRIIHRDRRAPELIEVLESLRVPVPDVSPTPVTVPQPSPGILDRVFGVVDAIYETIGLGISGDCTGSTLECALTE